MPINTPQNADKALKSIPLPRLITMVENDLPGYEKILQEVDSNNPNYIIGITGPPGAGKSSLVDKLIERWINRNLKVAVLCVDPSSPFHQGAILGDRIRMNRWYDHPLVYIRSLSNRGSLGGLHPKIIEIMELVRVSGFDRIIVETVGVGQNEVEIASLSDLTVVIVVPESGDEIQTMKSGIMEIADVFVVNKADRPDADQFANTLRLMSAPSFSKSKKEIPIIKTIATQGDGMQELMESIEANLSESTKTGRPVDLLAEKAYQLICARKIRNINKSDIRNKIESAGAGFNLFTFVESFGEE